VSAPLLVITGGMGRVAGVLRPRLRSRYRLRLVDKIAGPTAEGEELIVADLASAAPEVLHGADAVVHLAGQSHPDVDWDALYQGNIALTRQVLDAAAGVPKIVLGSSVHAAGGDNLPEHYPVDPGRTPNPCCPYGMSKVVMEALGRYHAHAHGTSVVCLRLGLTGWPLDYRGHLGVWLSDDDAARLVTDALRADVGFGIYFGVSANSVNHWDTTSARRELGYAPQDDASRRLSGAPSVTVLH
jgi:nucleoside-diphosphate-sugar epimerase